MTRKQSLARTRRLEIARQRLRQDLPGPTAVHSDHLHHLKDLLERSRPLPPLFLYCRASSDKQRRLGNVADLTRWSLHELERLGVGRRLRGIYECVESSHIQTHRPILRQVIADARRAGGIVVSPFRDRFIRHEHFDGTNESDRPTPEEYRQLLELADGVPLATILHPDRASRSCRTEVGIKAKRERPTKELAQRELLDAVIAKMRVLH